MNIFQKKYSNKYSNNAYPTSYTVLVINGWMDGYSVHLPNDTLSITFENTVFSLITKKNATVSIGSVLKWRTR
jgi:hypothetical protein